ncbi:MAG: c-type cytochrome [Acidobacteriota bacterium]|nr:c-type cytochrome [Acidobacteriota bacterium]
MSDKDTCQPDRVSDQDCDGIEEGDTAPPKWSLWTLGGVVVFAVASWFAFHTCGRAEDPVAEYEPAVETPADSVADLDARGLTEEDLIRMSNDSEMLRTGREVYEHLCQVCHLSQGQGLVGPNLTDDYWIHGGRAVDIHNTIVMGVVDKGMAAWGRQLGSERVDAVVAHLLTWRGKNIEGKEPQGEIWKPRDEGEAPEEVEGLGEGNADSDSGNQAVE